MTCFFFFFFHDNGQSIVKFMCWMVAEMPLNNTLSQYNKFCSIFLLHLLLQKSQDRIDSAVSDYRAKNKELEAQLQESEATHKKDDKKPRRPKTAPSGGE